MLEAEGGVAMHREILKVADRPEAPAQAALAIGKGRLGLPVDLVKRRLSFDDPSLSEPV